MKITVKKLQGDTCDLEVSPATTVAEIKRQVAAQLKVPVETQKLLLAGRTLVDDQRVESYQSIKDGTRLHLVVKKPEGLYEATVKWLKQSGSTDAEAAEKAQLFMQNVEDSFNRMSWDDFDRLCHNILTEEQGSAPVDEDQDQDADDLYGL